jgi:hypothetical protein
MFAATRLSSVDFSMESRLMLRNLFVSPISQWNARVSPREGVGTQLGTSVEFALCKFSLIRGKNDCRSQAAISRCQLHSLRSTNSAFALRRAERKRTQRARAERSWRVLRIFGHVALSGVPRRGCLHTLRCDRLGWFSAEEIFAGHNPTSKS